MCMRSGRTELSQNSNQFFVEQRCEEMRGSNGKIYESKGSAGVLVDGSVRKREHVFRLLRLRYVS